MNLSTLFDKGKTFSQNSELSFLDMVSSVKKDDILKIGDDQKSLNPIKFNKLLDIDMSKLLIIKGLQSDYISKSTWQTFLSQKYIVSNTETKNHKYFKNCDMVLVAKKENVGMNASRKPFSRGNYYDGYIFSINYNKLPKCFNKKYE